ncbi:unnamed protein product [Prorocentrum cordatum]|uniref:Uncharacterized protein n=1 Tax=Prorocentrum cordatum TaxID=2364126 RepID=A0ABN9PW08_9DINO|nr:unnamed protein product [Polarella glacialis]
MLRSDRAARGACLCMGGRGGREGECGAARRSEGLRSVVWWGERRRSEATGSLLSQRAGKACASDLQPKAGTEVTGAARGARQECPPRLPAVALPDLNLAAAG